MLALLVHTALAASIDNMEMGGVQGSPNTEGPGALWWNPARIAGDQEGTQAQFDLAYTWGSVSHLRDAPYGGPSETRGGSPVPYFGLTHRTPSGLAWGFAGGVPYATGGEETERGSAAYATRKSSIAAMYGMFGVAYAPNDRFAIGGMVAGVYSSMSSIVDMDTVPDLHDSLAEMGEDSPYTDDDLEREDYAATVHMYDMADTAVTGGLGMRLGLGPKASLGLSYVHSVAVVNEGLIDVHFGCPPANDEIGRFGAESRGVCHNVVQGRASSAFTLPARASAGLQLRPNELVKIELLAGWVGWSVQQDMDIRIYNVESMNPGMDPEMAGKVNSERPRAKDLMDSYWGGVDLRYQLGPGVMMGGKLIYDTASTPTHALSPANFDANTVMVTGMAAFEIPALSQGRARSTVSLGYTHHVMAPRTNTQSAYGITLDGRRQRPERYQQSHGNGSYHGTKQRFGATLDVRF